MVLFAQAARRRALVSLLTVLMAALSQTICADPFAANALRGMHHVNVAVAGVNPDFARYGLRADELRKHVEEKLAAAGIEVADDAAAQNDATVSQLQVKLTTIESSYGYYSYALALQARRKLPLSAEGSFVSENVWSTGQSGVSNPSDLRKLYAVVDALLAVFISAHGVDNGAAGAH